jgi:hypothetical protein
MSDWIKNLFPDDAKRTRAWEEMGEIGETLTLYRPTGLLELKLIADSGFLHFPPRLPDQPIFYPVLNFEYAEEIARDWNAAKTGVGFVTRFEVLSKATLEYEIQIVGSELRHLELWIPADQQAEFEQSFVGKIEVVAHYTTALFTGEIDAVTHLPLE